MINKRQFRIERIFSQFASYDSWLSPKLNQSLPRELNAIDSKQMRPQRPAKKIRHYALTDQSEIDHSPLTLPKQPQTITYIIRSTKKATTIQHNKQKSKKKITSILVLCDSHVSTYTLQDGLKIQPLEPKHRNSFCCTWYSLVYTWRGGGTATTGMLSKCVCAK